MTLSWKIRLVGVVVSFLSVSNLLSSQEPSGKSAEKPGEKISGTETSPDKATVPFQIQFLETHIHFDANGDSRKEVHAIVKMNNAGGAQQFSRLGFDYNRAFQQVEIPLVRITHANGGTSDVLPSAVTDAANPAVQKYPAYHDVRVKSVRILGLQEGDTVEYRVVTTTTHQPLAPDFWLEHTFDHSGQVLDELYEIDLPSARGAKVWTSEAFSLYDKKESESAAEAHTTYSWKFRAPSTAASTEVEKNDAHKLSVTELPFYLSDSDVAVSSYTDWPRFAIAVQKFFPSMTPPSTEIKDKAAELTKAAIKPEDRMRRLYDFVRQKIVTIDLPIGATGFRTRTPEEILAAGYATPEDKAVLLIALATAAAIESKPAFTGLHIQASGRSPVVPSNFTNVLVLAYLAKARIWLDPAQPVAPFGMVAANLRGKPALLPYPESDIRQFEVISTTLPFAAFQKVGVDATLGTDGRLSAKVKYTLRGDNELLLRVAFHQTPKEKWKEVAGLLALSDGFRGAITSAIASDPMETKTPFTVEYELVQEKFVDWAKKPVRIPALLPQIGLPEISEKNSAGNIDLGTPLDVETQETLRLPPGTEVQPPAGTNVQRDYATYSSKYGFASDTLTAFRHIHFIRREVTTDRTIDYSAFIQAVQNDQSQYFVLDRGTGVKSAALQ